MSFKEMVVLLSAIGVTGVMFYMAHGKEQSIKQLQINQTMELKKINSNMEKLISLFETASKE